MAEPHAQPSVGIAPAGYRLPAATRLGPVRLQVSDLARSQSFYQGVLGFQVMSESAETISLGAPHGDEPLVVLVERPGVRPVSKRGLLGLYHVAFLLPGRTALAGFVNHVADTDEHVGMSDHLVSEAVYLNDPDGLGIEVYADRPPRTWRKTEGQIEMATEPLNVRDLTQSAGDVHWTGMPTGTIVGHMHLHVGDLRQATTFYHEALGFDKTVWSYPGALFLSAGGYHHHLGVNTWARGATPATDDDARLLEWTIVLPKHEDVTAAANSIAASGSAISLEPRAAIAVDPWGTALRIVPEMHPSS